MKKQNAETAIETKAETPLATLPDVEEFAVDLETAEYSMKDLPRPVLKLVQSGSDMCKQASDAYNPEAKEGMFYLNSTKELLKSGDFLIVPVTMQKREIQYLIDGKKQIFMGEHLENSDISKKVIDEPNPNGGRDLRVVQTGDQKTILTNTAIWYCLMLVEKDGVTRWDKVTISLSSSQLRASSDWLGYLHGIKIPSKKNPGKLITPAFFWRSYRASAVPKSNDQHSWVVWNFTEEMKLDAQNQAHASLITDAAAYYTDVKAGSVKVDHEEV